MWLRLIVLIALAVVSATSIVRALAPKSWASRKPISCDVCMSFWLVVGACLALWFLEGLRNTLYLEGPAAHGLAVLLLSKLRTPELPPLGGAES